MFPGKVKGKKKKKKGGAAAKKGDTAAAPKRIKKAIRKWKDKYIDDKTRVTIIGCTSEPNKGSAKDFKKMFNRAIYFPFPDYTTRRLMWKTFIERFNGKLRQDFPLSTLALISVGYSAGSIKETCEKVLTEYRIKNQEFRPLTLPEFIGPLSLRSNTDDEEYEVFQKFTEDITGDLKIRKAMKLAEGGDDGKKKGKGKGKGKKKK